MSQFVSKTELHMFVGPSQGSEMDVRRRWETVLTTLLVQYSIQEEGLLHLGRRIAGIRAALREWDSAHGVVEVDSDEEGEGEETAGSDAAGSAIEVDDRAGKDGDAEYRPSTE